MATLVLSYNEVDRFVQNQQKLGNDVSWDGWTLVFVQPTHYGFGQGVIYQGNVRKSGVFHKGRWGVESRVPVDSDGSWRIPRKNVKFAR